MKSLSVFVSAAMMTSATPQPRHSAMRSCGVRNTAMGLPESYQGVAPGRPERSAIPHCSYHTAFTVAGACSEGQPWHRADPLRRCTLTRSVESETETDGDLSRWSWHRRLAECRRREHAHEVRPVRAVEQVLDIHPDRPRRSSRSAVGGI